MALKTLPCWTSIPFNLTSYCLALFLGDCFSRSCTEPTPKPAENSCLEQHRKALHRHLRPLKLLQTPKKVTDVEDCSSVAEATRHATTGSGTHLGHSSPRGPMRALPLRGCAKPARHSPNEANSFLAKTPTRPDSQPPCISLLIAIMITFTRRNSHVLFRQ